MPTGIGLWDREITYYKNILTPPLSEGEFSLGSLTNHFEHSVDAVVVNSGTAALELAIRYARYKKDCDSIAIPEMTVPMVRRLAIQYFGNNVQMMDVNVHDLSMDGKVEADCAVFVTTGGIPSERYPEYMEKLAFNNVFVIEDSSHSHGCNFGGVDAMHLGDASVQSWYATKVLTMGEGGLFTCYNDEMLAWAKRYANQGKERGSGVYTADGKNFRSSDVACGLGYTEWAFRDEIFTVRRNSAEMYLNAGLPYCYPNVDMEKTSFFKYPVYVDNKYEVMKVCEDRGIVLPGIVHDCMSDNPFRVGKHYQLPISRWVNEHQLCLPIGRNLTPATVNDVINTFREVAKWSKI